MACARGLMRISFLILLLLAPALLIAQASKPKAATAGHATQAQPPQSELGGTPNDPKAIINTTAGKITCVLFKEQSPLTVANFIGLATGKKEWTNPVTGVKKINTPLYDGTIFHRVIPNFMIQGGDPAGNGSGTPGYYFRNEYSDLSFDRPGRLAMANSGPNTNGSQFFITETPQQRLDGNYTIFGQCEPVSLVAQIARMPRDPSNDRPFTPVRITHIQILQPGAAAAAHKAAPAHRATTRKPAAKTAPKK